MCDAGLLCIYVCCVCRAMRKRAAHSSHMPDAAVVMHMGSVGGKETYLQSGGVMSAANVIAHMGVTGRVGVRDLAKTTYTGGAAVEYIVSLRDLTVPEKLFVHGRRTTGGLGSWHQAFLKDALSASVCVSDVQYPALHASERFYSRRFCDAQRHPMEVYVSPVLPVDGPESGAGDNVYVCLVPGALPRSHEERMQDALYPMDVLNMQIAEKLFTAVNRGEMHADLLRDDDPLKYSTASDQVDAVISLLLALCLFVCKRVNVCVCFYFVNRRLQVSVTIMNSPSIVTESL